MSISKAETSSIPRHRAATDVCLTQERLKADNVIAIELQIESNDDQTLQISRADFDALQASRRKNYDLKLNRRRLKNEDLRTDEQKAADQQLAHERAQADETLFKERQLADSMLRKERMGHSLMERANIQKERLATDSNLSAERQQSDLSVQTRDNFLAIVSHDLRTPLGAISMACELIYETKAHTSAPAIVVQMLQLIKRNAKEGLRLTEDLVDLERIATGKLRLSIETFDINALLSEAFETFKLHASAKSIALVNHGNDTIIRVRGDRIRMTQVLSNLLSNALRFTPSYGRVSMAVKSSGSLVEIIVEDSGIGIARERLTDIFERLNQEDLTDSRGLGLGLYISHMIVEAHHGRIWAESVIGRGSQFHISLPALLH